MAHYEFLTTWLLPAPRTVVWEAIEDAAAWPEWWRGVESVEELGGGDAARVGSRYRIGWRSAFPYTVTFEFAVQRVDRPVLMSGSANGDLDGVGTWRLYEQDGVTAVTYDWRVQTTKRWMNAIAPIAYPVFEWNHDWVMARGGEGLARRLGVDLLAVG